MKIMFEAFCCKNNKNNGETRRYERVAFMYISIKNSQVLTIFSYRKWIKSCIYVEFYEKLYVILAFFFNFMQHFLDLFTIPSPS